MKVRYYKYDRFYLFFSQTLDTYLLSSKVPPELCAHNVREYLDEVPIPEINAWVAMRLLTEVELTV